jgi:hypothetical protein
VTANGRQKARALLKALYVALCFGALGYVGLSEFLQGNLEIFFDFSNRRFWLILWGMKWWPGCLLVLTSVVVILFMNVPNSLMNRLGNRVLEWRLFPRNINFIPLDYLILQVPFVVLLYFNLPMLAFLEEYVFRDGFGKYPIQSWEDVFWRSVLFGLVHLISGCRIRECLAIIVGGMWFGYQYLLGGLYASTLAHFTCNALELTYMLGKWVITKKNPFIN